MTFSSKMVLIGALAVGLSSGAPAQDQRILELEEDLEGRTSYEAFGRSFERVGLFERLDLNDDGVLTREELNRGVFISYDRDLDDYLNTEEAEQLINEWEAPVRAGLHGTEQDAADLNPN